MTCKTGRAPRLPANLSSGLVRPVLAGTAAMALMALAPASASAHALMTMPMPRDNNDAHKDPTGPCGVTRNASQPMNNLTAGATYVVAWTETVYHNGCFVVDFSPANDANWQTLGTVMHPAGTTMPRNYTLSVTLPAAPCTACTLRVRQIMLNSVPATCPPATVPNMATYYTCANVVLGGGGGGTGGGSGSGGAPGSGGRGGSSGSGGRGSGGAPGSSGGAPGSGGAPASSGGAQGSSGGAQGSTGGSQQGSSGGASAGPDAGYPPPPSVPACSSTTPSGGRGSVGATVGSIALLLLGAIVGGARRRRRRR
jgi:hypothetical protein